MSGKLKESVENHPLIWLLGVALASFLAGLGAYDWVLRVAKLEVVRSGTFILLEDLERSDGALAENPPPSVVGETDDSKRAANIEERRDRMDVPVSLEEMTIEGVVFTNRGCEARDRSVVCEVAITALNRDLEIGISRRPASGTRLIEQNGREFSAPSVSFGNNNWVGPTVRQRLARGIVNQMELRFDTENHTVETIPLLEVVWSLDDAEARRVQFRETPLR